MNKKTLFRVIVGLTAFALILWFSPAHKIFARDRGSSESAPGETIRSEHVDGEDSGEDNDRDAQNTAESANIDPHGDFRVTGVTVNSVSGNVLNVSLFGVSKSIDIGSAGITGAGNSITIADIHPGDKLNGSGNFNETTKAVTVTEIRDISFMSRNTANIKSKIQQLWDLIQQLQEQLKKVL